MKKLLVLAFLVGCGGKQPAQQPPQPAPVAPGPTLSADDCTKQGGEVRGDIGDGKIACAAGERELGRVPLGVEGSICCAPGVAPAAP